jgi:hypothetical protein
MDPITIDRDALNPDFMDRCPLVPPDVTLTDWESDQVQRHWRNALHALDDTANRLAEYVQRLTRTGAYRNAPTEVVNFDHRVQGGGLTYQAMQAEAAMVQVARVIDGAIHRTAEARHNAAQGQDQ